MKRTMQILIAAVMLLSLFSCHRRPLTTADYTVRLDINIDRDIVNYEMPRDPEIMRVAFYDHNTGQLFTEAFLPPTGGEAWLRHRTPTLSASDRRRSEHRSGAYLRHIGLQLRYGSDIDQG